MEVSTAMERSARLVAVPLLRHLATAEFSENRDWRFGTVEPINKYAVVGDDRPAPRPRPDIGAPKDGIIGRQLVDSWKIFGCCASGWSWNEVRSNGLKHQKEKRSMDHFAGLDVSVKETSVCIVDDTGRIVREVKVAEWTGSFVDFDALVVSGLASMY
jgi:hypothetical protein